MAETYYVRSRGRISGPFDVMSLQKLVRRGMLSRAHEVSSDRQSWSSASDFEELFPQQGAAATATSAATIEPVAPPATAAYYYVQSGETVGPVSLAVMASLVRTGTIGPDDIAWSDGGQTAQVAAQVPGLAALFSAAGSGQAIGYGGGRAMQRPTTEKDRSQGRRALAATGSLAQVAGIVTGCVLVLFLNLPIASDKGRIVWWWDALSKPGAGTAGVMLFFVLFAGLAAGVLGITVRGLVRGWLFFGTGVLSLILLLVLTLSDLPSGSSGSGADAMVVCVLALLALPAGLIGVSIFRSHLPAAPLGRVFQPIFGGLLVATTLVITVVSAVGGSAWDGPRLADPLPGWFVVGLALAVIGMISAMTAGVLGIVGTKPAFSPAMNWTTVGAAMAAVLLPFLSALVVFGGAVADQTGLAVFTAFRMLAIFTAFLVLLAVGLAEVFVAAHVGTMVHHPSRV